MQEYERMRASGEFDAMPKKEALLLGRELTKLQKNLGGIRGLGKRPEAVFILDTKKEHLAVTEANKLGIPIIAVVDTNVDPDVVKYPIPGNDDAIRSTSLMCRVIADAVEEGRYINAKRNPAPVPRRSADEDAMFLAQQAEARRQAAAAQAEREARLSSPSTDADGGAVAETQTETEPTSQTEAEPTSQTEAEPTTAATPAEAPTTAATSEPGAEPDAPAAEAVAEADAPGAVTTSQPPQTTESRT
jgi:small subunit ribosomal protein S2